MHPFRVHFSFERKFFMKKQTLVESHKNKHLTKEQRCIIESMLNEGASIRHIAVALYKNPSTISREIKNHSDCKRGKTPCIHKKDCHHQHLCNPKCVKMCKSCDICIRNCLDYKPYKCPKIPPSGVCNSCYKKRICELERHIYYAKNAEKEYRDILIHSRDGFDLTGEELDKINEIVSPLIKNGLSPYATLNVLKNNGVFISESTLRRLIDAGELSVGVIDLRRKVKMKPRKKSNNNEYRILNAQKEGHKYKDFLEFKKNNDISYWEMDTVEGLKEDKKAILTLHNPDLHFQLFFLLPEQTSDCVVAALDRLEQLIGKSYYCSIFGVILTDNGHEFSDIKRLEYSEDDTKRTNLFFCEPNRSDQKGSCENNHHYLRYILPKGTSFENLSDADMVLLRNHINSSARASLFGKSPTEVAKNVLPHILFECLDINLLPTEEINLTPTLLKRNKAD